MVLRGVITALVTPFTGEGVDCEGLAANIADQLVAGVNGLIVLGTTGEDTTVLSAERTQIMEVAVATAKGKVPLIVGVTDNSTARAVDKAARAREGGADVLLLCMPYYNKPSQEGMVRHIEAVAAAGRLPIMLYNHPGRTGVTLWPETVLRLAKNRQIIGIKDCTGDLNQVATVLAQAPDHFCVMTGDDSLVLPMMSLGATGVCSVISNLIPRQVVQMVKAHAAGQLAEAREFFSQLYPFIQAAFIESNPIPIKTAMSLCGKAAGPLRLPLCELQPQNLAHLKQLLEQMQLLPLAKAGL